MSEYVISCCSTVDLNREHLAKRNIPFVCFRYYLNEIPYPDDMGLTMPVADFYKAMTEGADTRTSQVNVEEYIAFFESFLKEGKDVIHCTLSSGISGSYNAANIAMNEVKEKYPDRKIYVIDSLCASAGFGLLMDKMADKRDEGMDIDSLAEWTIANRGRVNHWFFTTDLTFFIKGGRVSKTAGFVGTILGICPLLNVNDEGKLIPRLKVRGKKKVIATAVDKMLELCDNGADYNDTCFISHAACEEDAKMERDLIEEKIPALKDQIKIFDIGTTIGSHTGPGTVALFFWGKEREN